MQTTLTRRLLIALVLLLALRPSQTRAQGGIGNMPRTDLVMVGAMERDSLADEVFARINDLKRYAAAGQLDSAARMIAFGKAKDSSRWARTINLQDASEKARAEALVAKAAKLFTDFPETKREYFAIFKDKDSPSGRKYLYQIHHNAGAKKRMVSWVFYPIGDKLVLGDMN